MNNAGVQTGWKTRVGEEQGEQEKKEQKKEKE